MKTATTPKLFSAVARPGVWLPKLAFTGLVLSFVLGCGALSGLKKTAEKMSKPTVLTSADGTTSITLPPGWSEDKELNAEAQIQASYRLKELYVMVLSESKEDFDKTMTLERYTEITRAAAEEKVTEVESSAPTETIINGQRALNYEMKASITGIKLTFLRRNLETPNAFHQVVTWTLRSRFEQNREALLEVANSFQEVTPPASDTPAPPPAPKKK